jgi:hypothetical protein
MEPVGFAAVDHVDILTKIQKICREQGRGDHFHSGALKVESFFLGGKYTNLNGVLKKTTELFFKSIAVGFFQNKIANYYFL